MPSVEQAFAQVQRKDFMLPELRHLADRDTPQTIGHGQTISQPTTVRRMLQWLDVQPGDRVLDVGSGSGWTTALLSRLVGDRGHVHAVERVPELVEFGRDNCRRAGIANATFFAAGDVPGLPQHAPFDRILVSAAASELPAELVAQLQPQGKLVVPVASDILEITRRSDDSLITVTHSGYAFVPLIS